jgi:hypothetical protein
MLNSATHSSTDSGGRALVLRNAVVLLLAAVIEAGECTGMGAAAANEAATVLVAPGASVTTGSCKMATG